MKALKVGTLIFALVLCFMWLVGYPIILRHIPMDLEGG